MGVCIALNWMEEVTKEPPLKFGKTKILFASILPSVLKTVLYIFRNIICSSYNIIYTYIHIKAQIKMITVDPVRSGVSLPKFHSSSVWSPMRGE